MQLRLHCNLSALDLHGFDGIEHEVHEHLLQLHTLGPDFGQFGREFGAHGNRASIGLTFQQCEHFVDDLVHVDQFTL